MKETKGSEILGRGIIWILLIIATLYTIFLFAAAGVGGGSWWSFEWILIALLLILIIIVWYSFHSKRRIFVYSAIIWLIINSYVVLNEWLYRNSLSKIIYLVIVLLIVIFLLKSEWIKNAFK